MEVIESQHRLYPENGILAHTIGYTGEISESELDNPDYAKYNQGQIIGKFGIEKQYNDSLMGVDGERQSVVDNLGKEREVLGIKEAIPGKNLQLTIDLDLQVVAELALGDRRGSVVALDPNTGEILAMASHPTFDPNKFAVRIKIQGLEGTHEGSRHSPAEPLHSGPVGSRFYFQAHRRARRTRNGQHRRRHHFQLPRRRLVLRTLLRLLGASRLGVAA
jgi:cell division protein FtsI/penicillin-binding protein 2